MNKIQFFIIILSISAMFSCAQSTKTTSMKTEVDTVSYSLGMSLGQFIVQQELKDVNPDLVAQAIRDMLAGKETLVKQENVNQIVQAYVMKQMQVKGEAEKASGKKFLDENGKKDGVTTTASGLQYKVLKSGTGTISPKDTSTVEVHYEGRLVDGTVFDSSYKRGQTVSFPLNGVIRGWTEGVQLMKVGDKFQFYIPGDLAYGANPPQGSPIKANSVLIFDVELVSIK